MKRKSLLFSILYWLVVFGLSHAYEIATKVKAYWAKSSFYTEMSLPKLNYVMKTRNSSSFSSHCYIYLKL